ncbi:MAG: fibro-slime domain-containing protein, partial [Atopobiaceae bacterium]|nr:fibro-slime domain-containing protein [Atopobiaceae bacterium]
MTRNKQQALRLGKTARTSIALALSLSMVLGLVPNGALQAWAEEAELQDVVAIEETYEDPAADGATEAEDPAGESAEPEAPADEVEDSAGEAQADEEFSAITPLATDEPNDGAAAEGGLLGVPAANGLQGANPNPVEMGKNSTDGTGTADTNSLGFVINLYDYEVPDTVKRNDYGDGPNTYNNDPQYQRIYGLAQTNNNTNSGINAGKDKNKDLKFYASGDGEVTSQSQYGGGSNPNNGINQFTGVGHRDGASNGTNFYTLQYANQGIVKSDLSGEGTDYANRYPVVNTQGGSNTAYLFDTNNIADAKTVYQNVNNLFYYENYGTANEKLVYDSNEHYAYYDTSQANAANGGDFAVYTDTYDRAGGSKSGMKVGFFPFDQYAAAGETPCINPNEGDWDKETSHVNHHLGLSMRVPLTMPKDGLIRVGNEKVPMEFEFSGDDDMWVFIDGKLVLDIGGIHQPVKGTINFATGEVKLGQGTVNPPLDDRANDTSIPDGLKAVNQNGHYSYKAAGIVDQDVLGDTAWLWTKDGHTGILGSQDDAVGREHVLQVFYLERGGCDSNLKITSNIHLMTEKTVEVNKEWKGVDESSKKPVQVRLVRKETNIDDPRDFTYVALETYGPQRQAGIQELNSSNSWDYKWTRLPSEGWREGSSNPR